MTERDLPVSMDLLFDEDGSLQRSYVADFGAASMTSKSTDNPQARGREAVLHRAKTTKTGSRSIATMEVATRLQPN